MHVHLLARSGPALLVGAILASAGHEVTARKGLASLRARLPGGWLRPEIREAGVAGDAELLLCGDRCEELEEPEGPEGHGTAPGPDTPRRVLIRSGVGGPWGLAGETECAADFDVFGDGDGYVELLDGRAALVVPAGAGLRGMGSALARHGVRLEESRDTAGRVASLLVLRLLDLPVALCNLTRESFLAEGDGRRIALAVLEEGLRVAEKVGLGLAPLVRHDPRELCRALGGASAGLESLRHAPGRRYPPMLAALWRGRDPSPWVAQRAFVKRAAEAGVSVDWNRRLLGLLPRVSRGDYLRDPPELLRAIA